MVFCSFAFEIPIPVPSPLILQLLLGVEGSCCVMRSEQSEPVTLFITELIRVPVFEPLRHELLLTRRCFLFPFYTQRVADNGIVKSRGGWRVVSLRISTDFPLITKYDQVALTRQAREASRN
jgi:hypothetical protein